MSVNSISGNKDIELMPIKKYQIDYEKIRKIFDKRAHMWELTAERTSQEFAKLVLLLEDIKSSGRNLADPDTEMEVVLRSLLKRPKLTREDIPFDFEKNADLILDFEVDCEQSSETRRNRHLKYTVFRMFCDIKTLLWPPALYLKVGMMD